MPKSRLDVIATHTQVVHLRELLDPNNGIAGGATPKAKSDAYVDNSDDEEQPNSDNLPGAQAPPGAIPFLRIQNISGGEILTADIKYIRPEIHDGLLRRSQLQAGDILLTITGRVGTAAVVPVNLPPANINQHIARLRLRQGVNPHYVAAFLNSELGQLQCLRYSTGTTRIALDYDAVRNIRVPVPSLEFSKKLFTPFSKRSNVSDKSVIRFLRHISKHSLKSNAILERNPEA